MNNKPKITDSKRLFFIPIIARALENSNPQKAIEAAFDEIEDMGRLKEYSVGFRQFVELIKTVIKQSGKDQQIKPQLQRIVIQRLIYDLTADTHKKDSHLSPEISAEIEILKNNQILKSLPISPNIVSLKPVLPDDYLIRLSTGRILWEGKFAKEDLIWAFAFQEKDIKMAAATDIHKRTPTRTIQLLNGEIILKVFAGIEAGEIKIEYTNSL